MDSLNGFPLIKKISLKYNAVTHPVTPMERLFSLGKPSLLRGTGPLIRSLKSFYF